MSKSIPAIVTPDVLVWARELDSISIEDAAAKMNTTPLEIEGWENGTIYPSLSQAKKLAKFYKVPFAYFYLPDIPQKKKRIQTKDYRTFGNIGNNFSISRELKWFLRDVEERRDAMILLYQSEELNPIRFPVLLDTSAGEDEIADTIRSLIELTPEQQIKFRKPEKALSYFINVLEKYDVLVFQAVKISPSEMRGLSLAYDFFPIIALNRKEEQSSRLFTLCHELVHIVTRTSGICNSISDKLSPQDDWEMMCNRIAGKVLVSDRDLHMHPVFPIMRQSRFDDADIIRLSRDFAVSKEVILHRLWDVGVISKSFYFDTLDRYTEEYMASKEKRPKGSGGPSPAVDKGSQVGKLYAKTVLSALNSERISARDASYYLLNLKTTHFSKLERWCF